MTPTQRRIHVADVISRNEVTTQDQILDLLSAEGLTLTQATLSRDLRDLGAVKRDGLYQIPAGAGGGRARRTRLLAGLARSVVDARSTGPLVVVRTAPGMAQAVAIELSSEALPEVLGVIAGVDTVFVAAESPGRARSLASRLTGRPTRRDAVL